MKQAKICTIFLIFLILISFISFAASLEARIGNSRMVLRLETGEKIEKYIKVINSNDVPVNISMTVSGDLADNIKIEDNEFTLSPGEEKNAYFTIYSDKEGSFESKINVAFTPTEGKNGVGIVSTVIVIAKGEWSNDSDSDVSDSNTDSDSDNLDDKIGITGSAVASSSAASIILILSAGLFLVALLVFLVLVLKRKSSGRLYEANESKKGERSKFRKRSDLK